MINPYEVTQLCVMCAEREVQIVVNSTGAGYCSTQCESSYYAEDEIDWQYEVTTSLPFNPNEDYDLSYTLGDE